MVCDGDNTGRFSGVVGNAMVAMKNQFVLKSYNPDLLGTLGPATGAKTNECAGPPCANSVHVCHEDYEQRLLV